MTDISKRLAGLSPEKRQLVLQKLQSRREARPHQTATGPPRTEAAIAPAERGEEIPLTFAQQRLWFIDQMEGQSAHYNEFGGQFVHGRLDRAALQKSLNEIVRRHEILRTTFPSHDGEPVQRIAGLSIVPLRTESLEQLPESERIAEVYHRAAVEAQQHFDLASGPLMRVTLLRLDEESHALFVTLHHIVCDNWSASVFIRELTALYQAFSAGEPSPLEDLSIQYADYAIWQRKELSDAVLGERLERCLLRLTRPPAPLELPLDTTRPARRRFEGENCYFTLDRVTTEKIKALSHTSGTTPFMTLLAMYGVLLARYSCQEDILVGVPIANRNRPETESLIGFFVNTLVIRIDLTGNPPFHKLLERVRDATLEAYAHQDVPLERVVEALAQNQRIDRDDIFRAMMIFQNAPGASFELPGLRLEKLELDSGSVRSDLDFYVSETSGELQGSFRYCTALFRAETVTRMVERFQYLVESVLESPVSPLDDLRMDVPFELPSIASVLEVVG